MTHGSQITLKLMYVSNWNQIYQLYFTNLKIDEHNGYVLYRIIIYKEYLTNGLLLKDLENGLLVYQESFSMTLVEKR